VSLLLALAFLTALPVAAATRRSPTPAELTRSLAFFPLVGLLLGGLLAGVDGLLRLVLPAMLVAALVMALGALLTGALHWDGLMDSCDGLLGARDAQRALDIMRDSRIGAFGALGAACVALIEWNALSALPAATRAIWIVLAFALSRWIMVLLVVWFPYARTAGLGTPLQHAGLREVTAASVIAAVAATALATWAGLLALAVCLGLAYGLGRWASGRLGGLTGDVYGAIALLCEVAVLILGTALSGFRSWW